MTLGGPPAPPLTASFGNVPAEHDGGDPFAIDLRFSEALGGGVAPTAASFRVQAGSVAGVERVSAGLWRVRVQRRARRDASKRHPLVSIGPMRRRRPGGLPLPLGAPSRPDAGQGRAP